VTRVLLPPRALLAKELRALLPVCAGTALVIGAASVMSGGFAVAGLLAFVLGSAALGAQAVGHEYTHGTLDSFLVQPADRRQLFATKLVALAGPLVLLTALAWYMVSARPGRILYLQWQGLDSNALLAVSALALFVAPALTMIARGVLGGAVFTLALPMVLLVVGDLAGVMRYGAAAAADVDAFKSAVVSWGIVVSCVVGGTTGWMLFVRLETDATPGLAVPTIAWGRSRGEPVRPRIRHPIALLLRKELRIQQMTFVVAGLYAALVLAAAGIEWRAPGTMRQAMDALTILTTAMLALLAGALASADERHLGTHAWQLLQPVSSRTQWTIKAGAAFGCALLLGVAMPVFLATLQPGVMDAVGRMGVRPLTATVLLMTSVSLYVSSLSTSGVRALVISLGVVFGAWVLTGVVSVLLWEPAPAAVLRQAASVLREAAPVGADTLRWLTGAVILVAIGALAAMLTWFAGTNHRTIGAGTGVRVRQAAVLGIALAMSVALFNLMALTSMPVIGAR
jgi:hypothetical protein